jgi:translation elongation factor EF-1alpha
MAVKKKAKKAKKRVMPAAKKAVGKKRVTKKKIIKKKATAKTASERAVNKAKLTPIALTLKSVGEVTHFFPHVSAGVVKLTRELKVGDMVHIKGHTTDFKQTIDSMQLEHVPINEAKKGQEIGLQVKDKVRIGDIVYKL